MRFITRPILKNKKSKLFTQWNCIQKNYLRMFENNIYFSLHKYILLIVLNDHNIYFLKAFYCL